MKTFAAVLFYVTAASAQVRIFSSVDTFAARSTGIEIHSGSAILTIMALRDVLRIRLGPQRRYDAANQVLRIRIPEQARAGELRVRSK
jgi:hypothetical protein